MTTLLPPNASELERAIEAACARATELPVQIRDLHNPDTCPVEFLPWLAWSLSVDTWRDDWSVTTKRKVLKASFEAHKKKGTIGSLRAALSTLQLDLRVEEWFDYGGDPFHFRVEVDLTGGDADENMQNAIESIINRYKNARSVLEVVNYYQPIQSPVYVAAGFRASELITIYPQ